MKTKVKLTDGKPCFVLEYENDEWEQIEAIWLKWGLKKKSSSSLFGCGDGDFYYETGEELKEYVKRSIYYEKPTCDDVNKQLFCGDRVNIGILRVVPVDKSVVAPLEKFINLRELLRISETIAAIISVLINSAVDKEIKITIGGANNG